MLLFDEADAIASRRSTSVDHGFQRESNTVVNVLLQELERFNGVVIFATNLAANFDPAFERRIRTHVLFEMPGVDEREQIWRVQMHPALTPLADDVDFAALARALRGERRRHPQCGAQGRACGCGRTRPRRRQSDSPAALRGGHRDVIAGKRVMRQSLFAGERLVLPEANLVGATASHGSPLVAYALAGAALLVALMALAVALLK